MLASMLALALMTHSPVTIEVGPGQDPEQAQRLRGDLIVRLLEAGVPIAAEAEYRVSIRAHDGGLLIEVASVEGVEHRTVEAGPEAAVRLEAIHRTLEMVRRLPPAEDRPWPRPVSIEVQDADGVPLPPPPMLVDALTERGLLVVPAGRQAAWRLCMLADGSRWAHMRVDGSETCETAYLLLERAGAVPEGELLVALERLSFETETTVEEDMNDPVAGLPIQQDRSPQSAGEARTRPGPTPFMSVSPGVAFRLDVADAVVGLRGGLTGARGFGGALQVGFLPSRAPGLSLLDTTVEAGPAFRRRFRERLVLGAGLFAGVLMHRFRFDDRAARTHYDFSVDAPLWLTWRVAGPLHLGFELGAGLSHRPRRHSVDGEMAWRRGALRLHAGVTLELAWGSSS